MKCVTLVHRNNHTDNMSVIASVAKKYFLIVSMGNIDIIMIYLFCASKIYGPCSLDLQNRMGCVKSNVQTSMTELPELCCFYLYGSILSYMLEQLHLFW